MHSATYCCLCWFKDKPRALNRFLYVADAFFARAGLLWRLPDGWMCARKVQVFTVSNVCTDFMYIKYICITFAPCVLNVCYFLIALRFNVVCVGRCFDPLTPFITSRLQRRRT